MKNIIVKERETSDCINAEEDDLNIKNLSQLKSSFKEFLKYCLIKDKNGKEYPLKFNGTQLALINHLIERKADIL